MKIEYIEKKLGLHIPERHKQAMLDSTDPIHKICDFLLPDRTDKMRDIVEQNEILHSISGFPTPWPPRLVVFASNGCGDYFAYDIQAKDYSIIYVDPDSTVEQNLKSDDKFTFASFEDWYAYKIA